MPYKDLKERKEKHKKFSAEHYQKNKDKYKKRLIDRRLWNKEFLYRVLRKSKCVDCGESNPICLEFDHLSNKKAGVAELCHQGYSIKNIKKEMKKCEVVCRNCHMIRTCQRSNSYIYLRHYSMAI